MDDWFSSYIYNILVSTSRLDQADLYAVLVTNAGWTKPTIENPTISTISSNLVSVASYSEKQCTSVSVVNDFANNEIELNATIPAFGNLERGQTVAACVLYDKRTVNSIVNPLVLVLEGDDRALTGGAFTVTASTKVGSIFGVRQS